MLSGLTFDGWNDILRLNTGARSLAISDNAYKSQLFTMHKTKRCTNLLLFNK